MDDQQTRKHLHLQNGAVVLCGDARISFRRHHGQWEVVFEAPSRVSILLETDGGLDKSEKTVPIAAE